MRATRTSRAMPRYAPVRSYLFRPMLMLASAVITASFAGAISS